MKKKIFVLLITLMMIFSLAAPAFAADSYYSIKIPFDALGWSGDQYNNYWNYISFGETVYWYGVESEIGVDNYRASWDDEYVFPLGSPALLDIPGMLFDFAAGQVFHIYKTENARDVVLSFAWLTEDGEWATNWPGTSGEMLPHVYHVPACGHDYTTTNIVEATCTETGLRTVTCANQYCGVELEEEILPALGHDFSVLIGHKDPTLTEEGYDLYQCSRCEETYEVAIAKLGITGMAITSYSKNLQDKNNSDLKFTVEFTVSDGTTIEATHTEKVNGQQKGSKSFTYTAPDNSNYTVYVEWNDNNKVTYCSLDPKAGGGGNNKGNQNQQ
ncbi:MAG: hypothetical protein FWG53_02215 [Clostridiales bacterium]|nr:hypothetical protein [Clostridiales bacterium]